MCKQISNLIIFKFKRRSKLFRGWGWCSRTAGWTDPCIFGCVRSTSNPRSACFSFWNIFFCFVCHLNLFSIEESEKLHLMIKDTKKNWSRAKFSTQLSWLQFLSCFILYLPTNKRTNVRVRERERERECERVRESDGILSCPKIS